MSDAPLPITGGCLCGAVRYSVSAQPLGSRSCWCRLCQYLAAGSATVNIIFPADAVTITGTLTTFDTVADSGNPMTRGFCPVCGTQMTSAAAVHPDLLILRAGTLDDPDLLGPQSIIWTETAPEWAVLDPALPQHPRGAPPVA